jgi:ribonuclease D
MPAPSRWREKDPAAALRLAAVKQVVADVAVERTVLSQNLLAGDVQRRLAWRSAEPLTEAAVRLRLRELGARRWQIELLAERLTAALAAPRPAIESGADSDPVPGAGSPPDEPSD